MPKIYNLRRPKEFPSEYPMRVDRGTEWGNPFIMDDESQRDLVCDNFHNYAEWRLSIQPHWLDPLKGKDLSCWCAPKRCHAETLLELANKD